MESRDEHERFENGVVPHDLVLAPEILALQALMEQIARERQAESA